MDELLKMYTTLYNIFLFVDYFNQYKQIIDTFNLAKNKPKEDENYKNNPYIAGFINPTMVADIKDIISIFPNNSLEIKDISYNTCVPYCFTFENINIYGDCSVSAGEIEFDYYDTEEKANQLDIIISDRDDIDLFDFYIDKNGFVSFPIEFEPIEEE